MEDFYSLVDEKRTGILVLSESSAQGLRMYV